jgi:hypothetical protein
VLWNPIGSSSVTSCQWGAGTVDVPITNIDRNGDMYTDFVVYRHGAYDGSGSYKFKNSTSSGGCTGGTYSVSSYYSRRIRTRTFAVSDMTGDGKPEIMYVDPDFMTIFWLTSESNYTTGGFRTIGDQRAILL